MRSTTVALAVTAAVLVLAGGAIHLAEWVRVYRAVPGAVAGADVVRIGFPANAVAATLLAAALVGGALVWHRLLPAAVVAAAALEAASLAALVASRTASVFGWAERGWSSAAIWSAVTAAAALVAAGALGAMLVATRVRPVPLVVGRDTGPGRHARQPGPEAF